MRHIFAMTNIFQARVMFKLNKETNIKKKQNQKTERLESLQELFSGTSIFHVLNYIPLQKDNKKLKNIMKPSQKLQNIIKCKEGNILKGIHSIYINYWTTKRTCDNHVKQ